LEVDRGVPWQKLGLVHEPNRTLAWSKTHCHVPTPLQINAHTIRVFYAGLDEQKFGRIGCVDLDAADPRRVLSARTEPVLDLGEPGAFDDSGVVPSCALLVDDRVYLYYIGFQRAERVPYLLFSGLATGSPHDLSLARVSRAPVLDRTDAEPFSRGAPFVVRRANDLKMWYWSCTRWTEGPRGMHYNTVIRSTSAVDWLQWSSPSTVCIIPQYPSEYAVGRPTVVHDKDLYRMWYSIRATDRPYVIGYAESADGNTWVRRDEVAGIKRGESGWDAEMICYPAVLDCNGRRYLFYNGNDHGADGFGLAVWSE
jgi:hypothetical protein